MKKILVLMVLSLGSYTLAQGEDEYSKGVECFNSDDYDCALKIFLSMYEDNKSIQLEFWIASCYFKLENFKEAKDRFVGIIDSTKYAPESSKSMINLGSCFRELGELDSAHYYYDLAIQLYPTVASAYFNKAQLLRAQEKVIEARYFLDRAIEQDSMDWFLWIKRQEVCFLQMDYLQALYDMKKAKEIKPDLDIDFNLAFCYTELKDYKKADLIYEKLYESNKFDSYFLNNFGYNEYKMGDIENAKDLIEESIRLNSNNSYAYRNLALIYLDSKDRDGACEYLYQAKKMNFSRHYGNEVDSLIQEHCK